jgi:hypothetical protein
MTRSIVPTRLRARSRYSGGVAIVMLGAAGFAGTAAAQVPAPAQLGDKVLPPVEILAETVGDAVRCSPVEIRLPAQDEIDLRLVNRTDQQITVGGPELFSDRNLVRTEGDIVHAASDLGYVVKPNATGRVVLRTPAPGQYRYSCAGTRSQGAPAGGVLEVVATK